MPTTKPMPAKTEWLRANVATVAVGVDREAKVLRGFVLAQEGPFKSDGRGEFDVKALKEIVKLGNAKPGGLKSRFAHPSLSDDGIGKFLGRAKSLRMDKATDERTGKSVAAVRGDLHFDESAFNTPSGDLAGYIMSLAETDPDALSSSLVLQVDELWRTDDKGKRLTDDDGNELPPLWLPKKLHATDLVDQGDAVDSLLSAGIEGDALPDAAVRKGADLLDRVFGGQSREVVEQRCRAWLDRYLELRFGGKVATLSAETVNRASTPRLASFHDRLKRMRRAVEDVAENNA